MLIMLAVTSMQAIKLVPANCIPNFCLPLQETNTPSYPVKSPLIITTFSPIWGLISTVISS